MKKDFCRACGKIHFKNYTTTNTEYGNLTVCNDECSEYWKGNLQSKVGTQTIEGHEVTLYLNPEMFKEPMKVAKYRKEDYLIGSKYVEFATLRTEHLHIACVYLFCGNKEVTSTHFNFRVLVLNKGGAWRRATQTPPTLRFSEHSPKTQEEALDKLKSVFERYLRYPNELGYHPKELGGTNNQLAQLALF